MLKCIVVLGSICLAVAVLLAAVNYVTAPIIEKNAKREQEKAFLAVLPEASDLETVALTEAVPRSIVEIRRDKGGSGYAFSVKMSGYGGASAPITAIVGINASGRITRIVVTDVSGESAGIGDKVADKSYLASFVGKDSLLDGVGTISGATISSSGFIGGVKDVFAAFLAVAEFEETEEQKIARLIYTVIDGMTDKNSYPVQVSDSSAVSVLRLNNGRGYAVALRNGDETLIAGISPFGKLLRLIDLDGNDLTASASAVTVNAVREAIAADVATIRARHAEDISALLSGGAALSPLAEKAGLSVSVIDAYTVLGDPDGVRVAAVASASGEVVASAVLSPIGAEPGELPLTETARDAVNLYQEVSGQ